jgi:hypothetical protein
VQTEIDAEIPVPHVVAERIVPTGAPHLEPVRVGVAEISRLWRGFKRPVFGVARAKPTACLDASCEIVMALFLAGLCLR